MKLLLLSDLHAHNEMLDKLNSQFENADAVLFAGDFAECFNVSTGKAALEKLCSKHDTIFAVLGNCDEEDFIEDLETQDICVEKTLVFHEGLALAGAGGGTVFTGKTAFERDELDIIDDFKIVNNSVEETGDKSLWKNLILICHNPPKGQIVDAVNDSLHAGSELFAKYIEENQPLAVVCGHIHEGRGIEKIGDTLVINPGSIGENGSYAELTLEKEGDFWQIKDSKLCSL